MKRIKVECPCCKTVMEVTADTGVVLSHSHMPKEKKSLEAFMEEEKNKASILDAKFNESKKKEKNKFHALEAKFKHAQEHEDELDDPPPSVLWD